MRLLCSYFIFTKNLIQIEQREYEVIGRRFHCVINSFYQEPDINRITQKRSDW